jgi:hypothetical protein
MSTYQIELWPIQLGKRKPKRYPLPLSLNARVHWGERAGVNHAWSEQMFFRCKAHKVPKLGRIIVEVEHHAIRSRDQDNLAASLKPILDAIVLAGVIEDDDEDHLQIKLRHSVKVHKKIHEKLLIFISPL